MRKVALGSVLAAVVAFTAVPASAQLELPALSPAASVSQRVGLTDIEVEYSSPGVKGRKIWGGLVPFDQPWRTGANAATRITFSRDVVFGGKPVPAGTYAIVTVPTEKKWTVVLSKELGLWVGGKRYDPKDDVVRVQVQPEKAPHRERMTFLFSNTTDDGTSLDLEWEKLRVSVPIEVHTAKQVQANIESTLSNAWRPHAYAARYTADTLKDYDTALKYVDASLAIRSHWFNNWIKADILAKKGRIAEAREFAQKAWELGQKDDFFFYKDRVAKALAEWKDK